MEKRPAHSPLGASGAERWMRCPGSVRLLQALNLPETDEPDYRKEGTAAHAFLERCLREGLDAWEVQGQTSDNGVVCDAEMANAIQVFLDTTRTVPVEITEHSLTWIEQHIDNPSFHPQFYGTVDYAVLDRGGMRLTVNDFKYGMGVVVECFGNPQIMYYAYGLLCRLAVPPAEVTLRIIQPRAFHQDGPVREWTVDADVIREWAEETLRPAMLRASPTRTFEAPNGATGPAVRYDVSYDPALWPGEHCRFCPAKLVCPAMHGLVRAAVDAKVEDVVKWDDTLADQTYPLVKALETFIKAVKDDTLRRLLHGAKFAHSKLVHMKTNRVFKDGAEEVLVKRLGEDSVYTKPKLKSPAEIEKLGEAAKLIIKEYAYTPESGLTVALTSDKRVAVVAPPTVSEAFAALAKELEGQ